MSSDKDRFEAAYIMDRAFWELQRAGKITELYPSTKDQCNASVHFTQILALMKDEYYVATGEYTADQIKCAYQDGLLTLKQAEKEFAEWVIKL